MLSKLTNVLVVTVLLAALGLVVLVASDDGLSSREQGVAAGQLAGGAALYSAEAAQDDATEQSATDSTQSDTQEEANDALSADEQSVVEKADQSDPLRTTTFQKGVVHLGQNASLGGRRPFPDDDPWNQPVDTLPVDPQSDVLLASIGLNKGLHPDFGSGLWDGAPIGIPYVIVPGYQPKVPIRYEAYGDQSDPGPYPIPPGAQIEGDPNTDGDRHVLVIDRDNWKLYELYRAFSMVGGRMWRADSGAIFDLKTNTRRPAGWTSADAAGLPIFPGLVRYDEAVELGEIRHALRFTVSRTRRAYVPPASHWASSSNDPTLPPMGMRVRLKKRVRIDSYPSEVQVILQAMKTYGMILADNGSDWYVSGAPDPRWDNDRLSALKKIKGSDFEVVLMSGLVAEE